MARKTLPISHPLETIRRRLERWRSARKHGSRIPERLWAAAVEQAGQCGLHRTARALGLNYYALKKRFEAVRGKHAPADLTPTFYELVSRSDSGGGRLAECTVEFHNGCGATMKISLKGTAAADLVALSRVFWGDRE